MRRRHAMAHESTPEPAELGYGPRLDRQLSALLGQTLFGPWGQQLGQVGRQALRGDLWSSRPRVTVARLVVAMVVAATLGGVVARGLGRNEASAQRQVAQRVGLLLRVGATEQLAALLADPTTGGTLADPDSAEHGLYCRAQATLFRYHDARRERLCDLDYVETEPSDAAPAPDYDRLVATTLPLPAAARHGWLSALRRAARSRPDEPQAAFVAATALADTDDLEGAEQALLDAVGIEPTNLIHLAAQARLLRRLGRRPEAADVLETMRMTSATDPWVAVARAEQGPGGQGRGPSRGGGSNPAAVDASSADTPMAPVPRAAMRMAEAVAQWNGGDRGSARDAVLAAAEAVSFQVPFLPDFANALLRSGAAELAQHLVADPRWPEDADGASAVRQRIAAAHPADGDDVAAGPVVRAPRGSGRTGRGGRAPASQTRSRRQRKKRRRSKKNPRRRRSRRP